jgi:hypothetical protein
MAHLGCADVVEVVVAKELLVWWKLDVMVLGLSWWDEVVSSPFWEGEDS